MKKYIYLILTSIFLCGCASGIKPLKFQNGYPINSRPYVENIISYTNSLQLVNPAQKNELKLQIPIKLSKTNNVSAEDIILPKEIVLTLVIPSYTNSVNLSGILKEKAILTPQAIFLYFFVLLIGGLVALYIWKGKKPRSLKAAIKDAEQRSVTTTVIPTAKATESTTEVKVSSPPK